MRYLLDTGIIARLPHRADPLNPLIREAMNRISADGHSFVTSTQNMAEFWNVCTRPSEARGGFGLSIGDAQHRLRLLERFITVLREPESGYAKWKSLVVSVKIQGKQVHDARLAALMSAYRIKRILTLNPADFTRYTNIQALTPQEVIAI
jgi:predicted nucleic acid-binding protein